jgi:hypothetical protein
MHGEQGGGGSGPSWRLVAVPMVALTRRILTKSRAVAKNLRRILYTSV